MRGGINTMVTNVAMMKPKNWITAKPN